MADTDELSVSIGTRILEDWAMTLSEEAPLGVGVFQADQPFYIASLTFASDESKDGKAGSVYVICQRSFAELLSRNLLGADMDLDLSENEYCDALAEMANLFAGHFVSEYFGTDAVVPLQAPKVERVETVGEVENKLVDHAACFLADGEPVALHYAVKAE